MIAKNKQSPNTLYLLNAKNTTQRQQEEERKSARLTFNKKKSARSISQYQKWNPSQNKEPSTNRDIGSINVNINHNHNNNNAQGQFYLPSSRNEEIKKIVLSRNQFGLEPMGVEKKLTSIIEIFKTGACYHEPSSKRVNTVGCETLNDNKPLKKSQEPRSGEASLLSLKEMNEKELIRNSQSRGKLRNHKRTESMLNHADEEQDSNNNNHSKRNLSLENIMGKIERKFKAYEKNSEDWRLKHSMNDTDYLIDDMLKVFKSMFNEITNEFTSYFVGKMSFYETSITEIAKDYEMQIAMLKDEIEKSSHANAIMDSMMKEINDKHYRGIVCSKILEDIALQGTNIENFVKTSAVYDDIIKITASMKKKCLQKPLQEHSSYNLDCSSLLNPYDKNTSNVNMCNSDDDDFYEEEKHDYVEQDSNWNDHFQNRESIKGVLKYIHNHNQNKLMEKETLKGNLNSTGYLLMGKDKFDMKIDNWKSFEDKSIGQYKKIMSQR